MTALPLHPVQPAGSPKGYKGPAGAILVALKKTPLRTARELAATLKLSLNAVRAHLKELEGEGLIGYERLHRGVGAPGYGYRLTAAGQALFPRRYQETLLQVLDYVVAREGRAAAAGVLGAHFDALARQLQGELTEATPEERMQAVARVLSEQGYMAEGSATFCCGTLVEHNCALGAVAERFPEVCEAEARFLESVLGGRVERRAHVLAGCSACEYKIKFASADADARFENSTEGGDA